MKVAGELRVPGDKSISHRALMLAALADGRSCIRGLPHSADVSSTAAALRALGCTDVRIQTELLVRGRGRDGLRAPASAIDCGNSGTTARLLAGVVAAHSFATRFVGDVSLSARPMRRVARPLIEMGAAVELERGDGLPMSIRGGALRSISWQSETSSAQVKSAILLAALCGGVRAEVVEPVRSRDHTERMLRSLGVPVAEEGTTVRLKPVRHLPSFDLSVPGDPSSAAYFVALGALADGGALALPDVCLNPSRTGFLRALSRMGAHVETTELREAVGEPVGSIAVRSQASLFGVEIAPADVPPMIDELPLLACIATRADGETTIRGAAELRVKESDRIATVVRNLRAVGADADERPDGLVVRGTSHALRGRIETRGDHRIAMAFGVLGAIDANDIQIDEPRCVAVSYPSFWEDLRRMTA